MGVAKALMSIALSGYVEGVCCAFASDVKQFKSETDRNGFKIKLVNR